MPRSATMQTRRTEKRLRSRSTTGIRLPVSAVFPGHISVHTGRPSPSSSTARIIWLRSGRWSLEKPRRPSVWPAGALEIEAGRVHEHDVERGQEVAPGGEQLLLQDVLHAARRKRRRGVLLVFGQFLARPRHRAIKMMQFETVDAIDAVVLAPAIGGAIRAAADEAVQHRQVRRAFQRELVPAFARQAFDHAPASRLLPHPLEDERRTDAAGRDRRRLAAVERVEHDRLLGEPRPRAQQALQLPARLQLVDPPERGDHLLADRGALAPALDDLQIGATAGGLLAEIHGGEPDADSIGVRTVSALNPQQSRIINEKRDTTFSCPRPLGSNHINGLHAAPMLKLSKISLNQSRTAANNRLAAWRSLQFEGARHPAKPRCTSSRR